MKTRCIANRLNGMVTIFIDGDCYDGQYAFQADAVATVTQIQWGGSRITFLDHTTIEVDAAPANVRRALKNAKRG